jgi:hypothetical protein
MMMMMTTMMMMEMIAGEQQRQYRFRNEEHDEIERVAAILYLNIYIIMFLRHSLSMRECKTDVTNKSLTSVRQRSMRHVCSHAGYGTND